ncbi:hypothetical protein WR25_23493 isoform B [Diploscapter pachys]|uniref:L-Fucosyltransferase n=2 Tax=Diploscapter pachys TaxID=2018661 RepID=A0A2A2LH49_9BILA|nr:hypothetical protein WR25_23493 isoform B [Diploscapter pachys]
MFYEKMNCTPKGIIISIFALIVLSFYIRDYSANDYCSSTSNYEPKGNHILEDSIIIGKTFSFKTCCSQLGNQLFRIFSGFGIEKAIGRKHILIIDEGCRAENDYHLGMIQIIFPDLMKITRTNAAFKISKNNVKIRFAEYHGLSVCCSYEDPTWRLSNYSEDHIFLETTFMQNSLYFERQIPELMKYLKFSEEVIRNGEKIINSWNVTNAAQFSCIHVRLTDHFSKSDANFSQAGIKFLLEKEKYNDFIIFGDDQSYMKDLSTNVKRDPAFKDSKIIINTNKLPGEDFYISSKLCSSFLMTNPESTFGWFLAFFSKQNNHVYFDHDMRSRSWYYTGFHRY